MWRNVTPWTVPRRGSVDVLRILRRSIDRAMMPRAAGLLCAPLARTKLRILPALDESWGSSMTLHSHLVPVAGLLAAFGLFNLAGCAPGSLAAEGAGQGAKSGALGGAVAGA